MVVNDESRPGIQRFYTEDPWSNRIELVDAETPGRAAEFPGESTSRRGQCRPPRPAVAVSPQPGWRNLRILAIPGSLPAASSNATLLDSAAALTPGNVEVIVYRGLAALPHFNPDLDNDLVSLPVSEFRSQLRISDGILFSTPEYAHGIPGVLKNALDGLFRAETIRQAGRTFRRFFALDLRASFSCRESQGNGGQDDRRSVDHCASGSAAIFTKARLSWTPIFPA